MRSEPEHSLDPRAVSLWRVEAGLRTALYAFVAVFGVGGLMLMTPMGLPYFLVALPLIALYGVLAIVVFPTIRHRVWRYHVDEYELDLKRGLFVVRRTLIPLVRVQHVDTIQGPVSKLFGLSSVTVSTAASIHEIPALSDAVAEELRDRLSALARVARESV